LTPLGPNTTKTAVSR